MPLTKELELKAKNDIIESINNLIDRYLREGVSIYDIKKYFKPSRIFNILLKDIHYVGRNLFNEDEDYDSYVRKLFNDIILDRISEIDMKSMTERKIVKYDKFLNESVKLYDIPIDILYNNVEYSDNDMDIISDYFKTRKEYISSKNPKYCTYTVTDFTKDITNNRITFDVLILSKEQIHKITNNIIKFISNGIYSNLPDYVEFMNIKIKPITFIDKPSLKESISKLLLDSDVIDYISSITNYKYQSDYGDYYIWKKTK